MRSTRVDNWNAYLLMKLDRGDKANRGEGKSSARFKHTEHLLALLLLVFAIRQSSSRGVSDIGSSRDKWNSPPCTALSRHLSPDSLIPGMRRRHFGIPCSYSCAILTSFFHARGMEQPIIAQNNLGRRAMSPDWMRFQPTLSRLILSGICRT